MFGEYKPIMNWDDLGFLLSKNKYSENSIISEVYTKNHGKVSGIIFGGTSKKIKNYLQIGNKIYINYTSKSDNKLGYFKVEIEKALSPLYFDNNQKLSCIASAMHLIKLLTAEFQKNNDVFNSIEKFYNILDLDNWIKNIKPAYKLIDRNKSGKEQLNSLEKMNIINSISNLEKIPIVNKLDNSKKNN